MYLLLYICTIHPRDILSFSKLYIIHQALAGLLPRLVLLVFPPPNLVQDTRDMLDSLATTNPLRFEPFTTIISPTFWTALARKKLDELKLDDQVMEIWGYYTKGTKSTPARFFITEQCLETNMEALSSIIRIRMGGVLKLFNTMEEFKRVDKRSVMNQIRDEFVEVLGKLEDYDSFKRIARFRLFAFADLKRHQFYYHCLYPTIITANFLYASTDLDDTHLEKATGLSSERIAADGWLKLDSAGMETIAAIDPSSGADGVVGWPLRNLLIWKSLTCGRLNLICLRGTTKETRLLRVVLQTPEAGSMEITGWERNEQRVIAPRALDLSPLIDPKQLAKEAADLNLRLIKWRLLPDLDLENFFHSRVLLLGAGTLGCNVARVLLGWGFKHITLIDNGKVSYSNPPRQSLFRFEDCMDGNKLKAEIAALRILEIDPSANILGKPLHIPMPGHRIINRDTTKDAICKIWDLIKRHDVVFLLTDSRESRWLPTVLGSLEGKIIITVAIGFDSYVVMRHGTGHNNLSCYFCNDVHSPGDTISNRTLDQQCTVARPGVSYIASGIAVELLATILQHPLHGDAPAIISNSPTDRLPANASILGAVPHQIRGYIGHFNNLQLIGEAFPHCTACSPSILDMVKKNGIEFILNVLEDPDYASVISGAKSLQYELSDKTSGNNLDDIVEFDEIVAM